MKKMNVNEWVWVQFTEYGESRYIASDFEDAGNGWYRFQLWDLMNKFGKMLWCGAEPVFKNNEIHFKKPMGAEK